MIHGGIEPALAMRVFLGMSFFTLASALRDEDNIAPTALPDRLQAMVGETMDARQILSDARFGSDAEFETLLDLLLLGLKSTVDENAGLGQHKQFDDVVVFRARRVSIRWLGPRLSRSVVGDPPGTP